MKIKSILSTLLEIITSPFTLIFRSNAVSNPNKKVNIVLVATISLAITALIVFLYYYVYKDVFK